MSMERIMMLSLVVVALLILGMAGIVVLLRNLHIFKSAKTDSAVDKVKE
jgi:uncharacterized membrane protein